MRKAFLTIVLTGVCISVFAQNSGVIRELSGTVELQHSGASSFMPANTGDMLNEDTVISTGFNSIALLEVGSALITVRPLTRLSLQEIRSSAGEETLNVNLQAGRVSVDLQPPAGTRAIMSVSSPNATASVRGTEFEMDTRRLFVREGRVSYRGRSGNMVNVLAGSDSTVRADGRPSNPHGDKRSGFRPPVSEGHEAAGLVFGSSDSSGPYDSGPSTGDVTIEVGF